jgi:hypothetical protein
MALGTSLFLIAVGAVLRFAVTATTSGFSIQTVGLILMIVGGIGLVISLFWMAVWADRGRNRPAAEDPYYSGRPGGPGTYAGGPRV